MPVRLGLKSAGFSAVSREDDLGIFDDPEWPILTRQPQRVPGRVLAGERAGRVP